MLGLFDEPISQVLCNFWGKNIKFICQILPFFCVYAMPCVHNCNCALHKVFSFSFGQN